MQLPLSLDLCPRPAPGILQTQAGDSFSLSPLHRNSPSPERVCCQGCFIHKNIYASTGARKHTGKHYINTRQLSRREDIPGTEKVSLSHLFTPGARLQARPPLLFNQHYGCILQESKHISYQLENYTNAYSLNDSPWL